MSFGEPKPVEGKCNARLHIGDNYGDNHATMLCQLEPGHDGSHQESYDSRSSGRVTVTWELEDPRIAIDALEQELMHAIEEALKIYPDFEWLDELQTAVTKYSVGEKAVFFRLDALGQIWVAIGSPTPAQVMPKAQAVQALLDGLKA